MSVAVVTSCSAEGFAKYGQRFVNTFYKYWPKEIALYVVSEDSLQLPSLEGRQVQFLSLTYDAPAPVRAFYLRHEDSRVARGQSDQARHNSYNFRTDAWKFSKKVFAINMAARVVVGTDVQKLVWLDADVYTFAEVPLALFDTLPPREYAIACLDRGVYHSECGFVSYNLAHGATQHFIEEFQRLYVSDAVFALREWHDSYVFDWLRQRLGTATYKIPHKSQGHPFVNSVLGTYMDHLKGNRKQQGSSRDHPRFRRPPYYYQNLKRKRTKGRLR